MVRRQSLRASERRGGWAVFARILLALAVIGVVAFWLYALRDLDPRLAATPYVELELPPPDESDAPGPDLRSVPGEPAAAQAASDERLTRGDAAAMDAAESGSRPALAEDGSGGQAEEGPAGKVAAEPVGTEPERAAMEPPPAPAPPASEDARAEEALPGATAVSPPPAQDAPATEAETTLASSEEEARSRQAATAGPSGPEPLLAWHRFASPFPADDPRPRIAIVVAELGLSEASTREAIEQLPAAVTLSFSPYGRQLQSWIDAARGAGHEVMLDLPMEPMSYPLDDPGPKALFTALPEIENRLRLEWVLNRAEGYVGVVPWMGSRFTASADDMRPVLAHIREEGLMFVDARPSPDSVAAGLAEEMNVPRAINTRFLDHEPSREAIEERLRQIEREAQVRGFAVGIASPYPITIETLGRWIATLDDKGLALAPISALANRQEVTR